VIHSLLARVVLRFVVLCTISVLAAAPALAVKRRAFVTSITGSGNLSLWPGAAGATALDKADAICRARATLGGLPNAVTYRAWLSTPTTDAYCHVQGVSGQKADACSGAALPGGGPWYLANGITNFSGTLDELTGPERILYRPVMLDENLDEVAPGVDQTWTGTLADGVAADHSCSTWTSASAGILGTYGYALRSARVWTYSSSDDCDGSRRLLCLEPGPSEVTTLGWSPGSLVFVSSATGDADMSTWPGAGLATGLAAADNVCRSLAAAAHLPAPQSFIAWLSDSQQDAADRLTSNGPYRRVDGYSIANSKADLLDGSVGNSIHVFENGSYEVEVPFTVFTETAADGTSLGTACDDWTSNRTGPPWVQSGDSAAARTGAWTNYTTKACDATATRLYCFSNTLTLFWDGFENGTRSRWSSSVP
jgi:hypothetical protein